MIPLKDKEPSYPKSNSSLHTYNTAYHGNEHDSTPPRSSVWGLIISIPC